MVTWRNIMTLESKSYKCGYCGNPLSSEKGWIADCPGREKYYFIYVCHHCSKPTFFEINGSQTPGFSFGDKVEYITDTLVEELYNEARRCMKENAYTAAVLCCRKLLMHIAVSKGAEENKNFTEYVEYLSKENYIPPGSKDWVDHIRTKGNEANHDIVIMSEEDAKKLISFSGMLLKIIYEFPASIGVGAQK